MNILVSLIFVVPLFAAMAYFMYQYHLGKVSGKRQNSYDLSGMIFLAIATTACVTNFLDRVLATCLPTPTLRITIALLTGIVVVCVTYICLYLCLRNHHHDKTKQYLTIILLLFAACPTWAQEAEEDNAPSLEVVTNKFVHQGFCMGITTQAQLALPHDIISQRGLDYFESRPGFGGESGLELSYQFRYWGISVGVNFGSYAVMNFKPHFENIPDIDTDNPIFQFENFNITERFHTFKFPIKVEFHVPLRHRFWLVGDVGVKFSPLISGYRYGTYNYSWFRFEDTHDYFSHPMMTSAIIDLGFHYVLPYGDLLRCTIGTNLGFSKSLNIDYRFYNPQTEAILDNGQISGRNHSLNLQFAYIHTFHRYKTRYKNDQSWRAELPSHEFQLNFSLPVMELRSSVLAYMNHYDGLFHRWASYTTLPDITQLTEPVTDYAITRYVPIFSFNYHYRVNKWFWVGGLTTITGIHNTWRDRLTDERTGSGNEVFWSIMPDLRFSYLNRKHITLYSGFGVGLLLWHVKDPYADTINYLAASYQLTLFGIKAGANHWFGNLELGAGYKGFISVGVGYEF